MFYMKHPPKYGGTNNFGIKGVLPRQQKGFLPTVSHYSLCKRARVPNFDVDEVLSIDHPFHLSWSERSLL